MPGGNQWPLQQIKTNLIWIQLSTIKSKDISQSSVYIHNYKYYQILTFVESPILEFYLHPCFLVFFFSFVYVQPTEKGVLLY